MIQRAQAAYVPVRTAKIMAWGRMNNNLGTCKICGCRAQAASLGAARHTGHDKTDLSVSIAPTGPHITTLSLHQTCGCKGCPEYKFKMARAGWLRSWIQNARCDSQLDCSSNLSFCSCKAMELCLLVTLKAAQGTALSRKIFFQSLGLVYETRSARIGLK